MTKTCPSCGTATAPETRFCRRCGTPLRAAASDDGSDSVSPIAKTIPLSEEGRTTDGLAGEGAQRLGPDTGRVNRAELDALLRPSTQPSQSFDPHATIPHIDPSHLRGEQSSLESAPESFDGNSTVAYPTDLHGRPVIPSGEQMEADRFDDDEELTVTVTRPDAPPAGEFVVPPISQVYPQQPPPPTIANRQPQPPHSGALAQPPTAVNRQPPAPAQGAPRRRYLWFVAAAAALFLLLITVVAVWLGVGYFRKPAPAAATSDAGLPVAPNPKQQFEEKLAEAQALLASGDLDAAIARLREATALDPTNSLAHRKLGDLLLDSGRRREAIEEFRAAVTHDERDVESWRSLARAQIDESLYRDAAASYRRLVALNGEAGLTDNELLSYAESLRLSGQTDEARPLYERLASSSFTDVASAAKQHLSQMSPSASPTPLASPTSSREANEQLAQNRAAQPSSTSPALPASTPAAPQILTPAPAPTPAAPAPQQSALSAGEHFQRGEQLWSANRSAALNEFRAATRKGNRDGYYYLGLSIVEGRNPKTLQRAELLQALQYFQNAKSGKFRSQAQRYEDQLGKEYDRLRNQ